MQKIVEIMVIVFSISIVSCGREKITPIYQPLTVNELKNNQPLNFSYQIDDTQIDEYARNAGKFPIFGKLFQAIARVLANATISSEGGHGLDLPEVEVDLNSLSKIDFNLIEFINLNTIFVQIRDSKSHDTLAFIDKLEIYAKLDSPIQGLPVDEKGYSRIVYYDKNVDQLNCDGKCFKLNIINVDWKELLRTNRLVHLQPKLIVNSVPASTMKLAGSVDFNVKFNVGF